MHFVGKLISGHAVKRTEEKKATTVYLPENVDIMLDEIYIKRLRARNRTDRSRIMCEAIQLLFEKEIGDSNDK